MRRALKNTFSTIRLGMIWLACLTAYFAMSDTLLVSERFGIDKSLMAAAIIDVLSYFGSFFFFTHGIPAILSASFRSLRSQLGLLLISIPLIFCLTGLLSLLLKGGFNVRVAY